MQPKTIAELPGVLVFAMALVGTAACGEDGPGETITERPRGTVVSSDGVEITYEVHGAGPTTLVFVHGWSCDKSYWAGQIDFFAQQYEVVTLDLGGHGESGLGRPQWTIGSFGHDVAAVVEELRLQDVIFVGHSMGGDVIMETARQLPDRVRGLVWIDTYGQLGGRRTASEVEQIVAPFREDFVATTRAFVRGMFPPTADAALVERVVADMSSAPPSVALQAIESALEYANEVTVALDELSVPVISINPAEPAPDVASLESFGVEVVQVTGVGHFLMMEDPEGFNGVLSDVLDRLLRL